MSPPAVALAHLTAELNQATQCIAEDLKKHSKEIAGFRSSLADATRPKKLRAVGSVKRVVLYETEVRVQGKVVPLSPDVQASALTLGVVRDRAWGADEDRRELTLNVSWPGGAQTVHWERNNKSAFGALVTPGELHKMAAAINTAAAASTSVRARITASGERHRRTLAAALDRVRAELEAPRATLKARREAAEAELARMAPDDERLISRAQRNALKEARRSVAAADDIERRVVALLHTPLPVVNGHHDAGTEGESAIQPSSTGEPSRVTQAPPVGRSEEGKPGLRQHSDIELLERLAKLHEQGVLSSEEFTAKKAEILERL